MYADTEREDAALDLLEAFMGNGLWHQLRTSATTQEHTDMGMYDPIPSPVEYLDGIAVLPPGHSPLGVDRLYPYDAPEAYLSHVADSPFGFDSDYLAYLDADILAYEDSQRICECEQDYNCTLHSHRVGTWIETRYADLDD